MTRARIAALLFTAAALAGCTPDLDDRASLVSGPVVLAIASTPAEASHKPEVTVRALYVDTGGVRTSGALDWAFCVDRKPLTEQGSVSPTCLAASGPGLLEMGAGATASGPIPADACRIFGPDRPEPKDGEPAGRAVDPDPSGGFYQPVRLRVSDESVEYAIGSARVTCGIGGATQDQAAEFGRRYRVNANPTVAALVVVRNDSRTTLAPEIAGGPPSATVGPGETLHFEVSWAPCPSAPACGDGVCGIDEDPAECAADCKAPKGCPGAEQYLVFDTDQRAVVTRREAITVSWFVTGGRLLSDRTGRGADEALTTSTSNAWTAPDAPGDVHLWVVIRDDRGGVGWQGHRLHVGP